MDIIPRDPGAEVVVEGRVQELVETEWEGNDELDGREAHEAEVAIGIETRGV